MKIINTANAVDNLKLPPRFFLQVLFFQSSENDNDDLNLHCNSKICIDQNHNHNVQHFFSSLLTLTRNLCKQNV